MKMRKIIQYFFTKRTFLSFFFFFTFTVVELFAANIKNNVNRIILKTLGIENPII